MLDTEKGADEGVKRENIDQIDTIKARKPGLVICYSGLLHNQNQVSSRDATKRGNLTASARILPVSCVLVISILARLKSLDGQNFPPRVMALEQRYSRGCACHCSPLYYLMTMISTALTSKILWILIGSCD